VVGLIIFDVVLAPARNSLITDFGCYIKKNYEAK